MTRFATKILLAGFIAAGLLTWSAPSFAFPKKGKPAPPFQVVSTSGQKLSLSNYKGSVLVIEFFTTWCGGCKESIPHLANLQKQFGEKGLQILALNIGQGDSLEQVKSFIDKYKISYPVALADESVVYDDYAIRMVPTLFIVDKKGVLVEKLNGYNSDIHKTLEATVKRLIAE
jgi:peroxiredoxin